MTMLSGMFFNLFARATMLALLLIGAALCLGLALVGLGSLLRLVGRGMEHIGRRREWP